LRQRTVEKYFAHYVDTSTLRLCRIENGNVDKIPGREMNLFDQFYHCSSQFL